MYNVLPIKILPHAKDLPLPSYATPQSSGMDLAAAIDEAIIFRPRTRMLIPTGLSMALPMGLEAQIRPRSGLAFKNGITVLNTPGTIDADFRGEIKVLLIHLGEEDFVITRGMRIAQLVIAPVLYLTLQQTEDLDETPRGEGGFGSTGTTSQGSNSK